MLNQIFNNENAFWRFASKVFDMLALGILWAVTSIPLVTVGAASAAFWEIYIQLAGDKEGHIAGGFFRSFHRNLKTGTAVWLLQLAAAGLLLLDLYLCFQMKNRPETASFLIGVFVILLVFLVLVSTWLYPLIGVRRYSLRETLSNSLFLTMRHLPHTAVCPFLILASLAVSCYIPYIVWILPPLACYLSAKVMMWVFSMYPRPEENQGSTAADKDGKQEEGV